VDLQKLFLTDLPTRVLSRIRSSRFNHFWLPWTTRRLAKLLIKARRC